MNLQDIVQYAYDSSEGWKQRFQEDNVNPEEIKTKDDLIKLSILKKVDLPDIQKKSYPFGDLSTVSGSQVARIFMSPGPIYDPQTVDGDFWRFSEALEAAGFNENDIVQNTFSYHLSPAGFMFDSALRRLGATVVPTGVGNTDLQIQAMKDLKVTGFVGTPSYFATLLDAAEEKGWNLEEELSIKKVFFTAEMLPKNLRESYEKKSIKVSEGYGTADVGCIAFQDQEGPGLRLTSGAIVQICDPVSGELVNEDKAGEIVVTLLDKSYPLLRFGTGDLSKWVSGYEGERIEGVLGRVSDGIKVKGMFVHQKQLDEIMAKEPYESYQGVISREGHTDQFDLYIETDSMIDPGLQERLTSILRVKPSLHKVNIGSINKEEKTLVDKRNWNSSVQS